MSAAVKESRPVTVAGAPLLPQVNLLPPEVRAGRALGRVKGWLAVALLAVVLVIGMVFLWATWTAKQAEQELARVQEQNQVLLNKQAEFAEVPQVLGQVSDLESVRTLAMGSEVTWQSYLAAVAAVTPTNVSVDSFTVSQNTIWSASGGTTPGVLATAGTVGTVTINGRSTTVPSTADWEDGLAGIPGIVDVEVNSVALTDENGSSYYATTATMRITDAAFAGRFADEEN